MSPRTRIVCLVIIPLVFSSGCSSLQDVLGKARPRAKLTGVNFGAINREALELVFDVEVDNPYPLSLPLANLDYSLTSGKNEFIAGAAKPDKVIPAGSKEEVALPVRVDYSRILQALKGIRPGATIPYKAQLVLAVDTQTLGTIDLPLKKQGEITLPSISTESLKDLWELIKNR